VAVRRLTVAILALVALMALPGALMVLPATALADGDPASDVLLQQDVFVPRELTVSPVTEQLQSVLAASAAAGFPIKVALIDTSTDLGTVSALWNEPPVYAAYLWKELSLNFNGQVLVLMPGGYGLHGPASGPRMVSRKELAVVAPATGTGEHMAAAAAVAVERLAASAGHPLSGSALRAAAPVSSSSGGSALPWIALVAGLVIVVAAWGASVRARPVQLRRETSA
jgi:hypothetical protein